MPGEGACRRYGIGSGHLRCASVSDGTGRPGTRKERAGWLAGGPQSNIDLHILLRAETKWCERGNRKVDGYLIEYFANPPAQVRAEFLADHKVNSYSSMVMFSTGEILFDRCGDIAHLRREAEEWIAKPFRRLMTRRYFTTPFVLSRVRPPR